jgi:hypothetical protein
MLHLPVSLGEAIDKLTILDIKLDKITDTRRDDVKKEYDLLYYKLQEFIVKYENLYQIMKRVNLLIWDMMDILRDIAIDDDAQYLKICRDCIEYNDIRFRVKNKINFVSMSLLKEQKSYKINRMIIVLKQEVSLVETFARIVKYFSFVYDEINIVSDLCLEKLKETFSYDTTILFKPTSSPLLEYKKIYTVDHDDSDLYKLFEIDVTRVSAFN